MTQTLVEVREEVLAEVLREVALTESYLLAKDKDDDTLRRELEATYGADNVWNTTQLSERFEVIGFLAPFCVVRNKADQKVGSVQFTHRPRLYFDYTPDDRDDENS